MDNNNAIIPFPEKWEGRPMTDEEKMFMFFTTNPQPPIKCDCEYCAAQRKKINE